MAYLPKRYYPCKMLFPPWKVVYATFLLVCFVCLKKSTCKTWKKKFISNQRPFLSLSQIFKNSLFQGFFKNHLQCKNKSRNSRNSRTTGHPVFPSFPHFSDSKGHKFADLILGIGQKLCYITSSPVNEWRGIAPACAHTYQYLFRCAIIARAILCMSSQSHYNTSTSVSVILLKRYTLVAFTCFYLQSFGRSQSKSIM